MTTQKSLIPAPSPSQISLCPKFKYFNVVFIFKQSLKALIFVILLYDKSNAVIVLLSFKHSHKKSIFSILLYLKFKYCNELLFNNPSQNLSILLILFLLKSIFVIWQDNPLNTSLNLSIFVNALQHKYKLIKL